MGMMLCLGLVLLLQEDGPKKLLPADPGLDGGRGGHWGLKNDKHWRDGRWNAMDVGPFVSNSLDLPGGAALKGLSVRVGDEGRGAVCYDTEHLGLRAGWTGGFVAFDPARFGLIGTPRAAGKVLFSTPAGPAWGDVRTRFRGFHLNGRRVVLDYTVDGVPVLESPWLEADPDLTVFTRTFRFGPGERGIATLVAELNIDSKFIHPGDARGVILQNADEFMLVRLSGPKGPGLERRREGERVFLSVPARSKPVSIKVLIWKGRKKNFSNAMRMMGRIPGPEDLEALAKPGDRRWGDPLVTRGSAGTGEGPYVIDTLTAPFKNPFKALLFLSGIDFFENGDAAVCTVHGDVWRVGGIDGNLERLTWRRYATGLYQPLGLRIVGNRIHVRGRDRITRLTDGNGDGEADFYENFNSDVRTKRGHVYVTCLERDAKGNFYFADPDGLHRVAADGSASETIATGWRHPNGLSVGPDGTITVAPQEGEWTPASAIFEVKPGGYYGCKGPRRAPGRPLGYDPPLCWIPRLLDNSTGSQVWVTSDRWGPLRGKLLNLSFGRSSMQLVLREKVGGVAQGGVVPTRLHFSSGAVRARFRPQDGQLYVAGMRGWVTSAVRDGCLQRVRYTGGKVLWPVGLNVHADGVRIAFAVRLDRKIAADPDAYALERWNYRYSKTYGSKEYSVAYPDKIGHDPMEARSAQVSEDGRSVFLEIPNLRPAHQVRIRYGLKGAAGETIRGQIAHTIHALGPPYRKGRE